MFETHLKQTSLAHLHLEARPEVKSDAIISECLHYSQTIIRGNPNNRKFTSAIKTVTGLPLPTKPCTSSGNSDERRIFWIGPDEWLLLASQSQVTDLLDNLSLSLKGVHSSIISADDARAIIRISGIKARDVLMKGCSIDFHPKVFKPGTVVNTLLAQTQVIVQKVNQRNTNETFDVFVFRSFADYLWTWLEDARQEFQTI